MARCLYGTAIKLHRAILVASSRRYCGPVFPHTPLIRVTPIVLPPRTAIGLSFLGGGTNSGYSPFILIGD